MKIGIDLRGLQVGHEFRGIGTVIRSVVNELFALGADKQHEIVLYNYDSSNPLELLQLPADARYKTVISRNPKKPSPTKSRLAKAASYAYEVFLNHWRWSPVPKTGSLDIFLQFDQHLGLPRNPFIKKVLVVHDLIPFVFKKHYLPRAIGSTRKHSWKIGVRTLASNLRYWSGVRSIYRADQILAISENTKKDIVRLLKIKPNKIKVVYVGGLRRSSKAPVDLKNQTVYAKSEAIDTIIGEATRKPYLLFIGGPEPPRRRLDHLVTAYHHLRAEGYDLGLVLAGKELAELQSIPSTPTRLQLSHRSYSQDVHLLGFVSDQDIDRLYSNALAFVFPSIYEGFGLPILEAMESSCPVITYNNSSIPEVAGRAAILIEPGAQNIETAVIRLLTERGLKDNLRRKGLAQVKKFTWRKTAKKILKAIE